MKVRIKGGTYGWRDELGRVTRMHAGDECEVSETEGARLCSLGIAESAEPYEPKPEAEPETEVKPEAGEETEGEGENEDRPEETPEAKAQKEFSGLTVAELRELCIGAGMKKSEARSATKAACVAFLTAYVYPPERPAAQAAPSTSAGGDEDIIV